MAASHASRSEFWVGIGASILASLIAAGVAWWGIKVEKDENQRVHDSRLLKELGEAVSAVRQQLLAQAGSLLEFESCMSQRKALTQRCRRVLSNFDAAKLVDAWTKLDGTVRAATPFFTSDKEAELLAKLKGLKKAHASAVDLLLPANSAKSAAAILERTRATMDDLVAMEEQLFAAAAERSRR